MVARYYLEETWKPSGEKTFAVLSTVDVPMARSWERFEFMQYVIKESNKAVSAKPEHTVRIYQLSLAWETT